MTVLASLPDLGEGWRFLAIIGIITLMVPAGWAVLEYWSRIPWGARIMSFPIALFASMVIAAIVINIFGTMKPTDGVKFISMGVWICAIWAIVNLVRIIRRDRRQWRARRNWR